MSEETRADWEKHKNYPPRWSWAIWKERITMIFVGVISAMVGMIMFIGIILVLGLMIEGTERYNTEHDQCLKDATNGYEIKQCR